MTDLEEVPLAEAAARLGVTLRSLKRYVQPGGKIPDSAKRKDERGRWLIDLKKVQRIVQPRPDFTEVIESDELAYYREQNRRLLEIIVNLTAPKP